MKNKSNLFSGKFLFKGTEEPSREVKSMRERETVLQDTPIETGYELYSSRRVKEAEQAALSAGQVLTDQRRDEIRIGAKLELNKWNAQARDISYNFGDAPVFFSVGEERASDLLSTQERMLSALGIEMASDIKGLFPGIEKFPMEKGQFLVVLDGGKKIQIVGISKEADKSGVINKEDMELLVSGERNEKVYAGIMKVKDRFTADGGVIKFKSEKAEKVTTLGEMFSCPALIVDGKLAVKGEDGQYHNVVEKRGGKIALAKTRVYVKDGTKVEQDISTNPAYVAILQKITRKESDTV